MTYEEFADALDGLMAYDHGSTDSGVRDEALRSRIKVQLHDEATSAGHWLERFIRERMVSEEAVAQGYGAADVAEFLRWLSDPMDYDP